MKSGSKVISIVARPRQVDVVDPREPARPRRHDDDAVGEEDRLADVVRDEHDRLAALAPEPEQKQVHLVARERVERAERLVHQQHVRVLRQRADDRRALLHPARELARHRAGRSRRGPVSASSVSIAASVDATLLDLERELDVLAEVPPRQQVRLLEDHPDLLRAAARRRACRRGRSGPRVSACSPDIAQRSVVLPQPLGPRIVDELAVAARRARSPRARAPAPLFAVVDLRRALDPKLRAPIKTSPSRPGRRTA